jgi:hypothetical protein
MQPRNQPSTVVAIEVAQLADPTPEGSLLRAGEVRGLGAASF